MDTLTNGKSSRCVDCRYFNKFHLPKSKVRLIITWLTTAFPWALGGTAALYVLSWGPEQFPELKTALWLLWCARIVLSISLTICFGQFIGKTSDILTSKLVNYTLCFSHDVDGNLHIHSTANEPMRLPNGRRTCELQNENGDTSIVHREKNTPVLEIQIQGLQAGRTRLHNRRDTKWNVGVDHHWRLIIQESDGQALSLPLFECDADGKFTDLSTQSIPTALRLPAEATLNLRTFVEKGLTSWQDGSPAIIKKIS